MKSQSYNVGNHVATSPHDASSVVTRASSVKTRGSSRSRGELVIPRTLKNHLSSGSIMALKHHHHFHDQFISSARSCIVSVKRANCLHPPLLVDALSVTKNTVLFNIPIYINIHGDCTVKLITAPKFYMLEHRTQFTSIWSFTG